MASSPDPHFVVESLIENAGGAPLVLARRIDDHDFLVQDGSLLNGAPIAAADILHGRARMTESPNTSPERTRERNNAGLDWLPARAQRNR